MIGRICESGQVLRAGIVGSTGRQGRRQGNERVYHEHEMRIESGHGFSISEFSFLVKALPKKKHTCSMVAFIKLMMFHKNVGFDEAL